MRTDFGAYPRSAQMVAAAGDIDDEPPAKRARRRRPTKKKHKQIVEPGSRRRSRGAERGSLSDVGDGDDMHVVLKCYEDDAILAELAAEEIKRAGHVETLATRLGFTVVSPVGKDTDFVVADVQRTGTRRGRIPEQARRIVLQEKYDVVSAQWLVDLRVLATSKEKGDDDDHDDDGIPEWEDDAEPPPQYYLHRSMQTHEDLSDIADAFGDPYVRSRAARRSDPEEDECAKAIRSDKEMRQLCMVLMTMNCPELPRQRKALLESMRSLGDEFLVEAKGAALCDNINKAMNATDDNDGSLLKCSYSFFRGLSFCMASRERRDGQVGWRTHTPPPPPPHTPLSLLLLLPLNIQQRSTG